MLEEPLRTTTFTLTRADLLAYEQAAFRWGWRGGVLMLLWLAACGGAALLIPPDWAGERFSVSSALLVSIAVVIGAVLVLLGISLDQWERVRRRMRQPVEITVSEWPDRLVVTAPDGLRDLPYGLLTLLPTASHLFLVTRDGPVILPRSAFRDELGLADLEARIAAAPRIAPLPRASTSAPAEPLPPAAEPAPAASTEAAAPAAPVDPAPPSA